MHRPFPPGEIRYDPPRLVTPGTIPCGPDPKGSNFGTAADSALAPGGELREVRSHCPRPGGGMADTKVLEAFAVRCAGSSPVPGTLSSCLAPLGKCRGQGAVEFASDARGRFHRAPPNPPPRPSRTQHHRIFRRANGDLPRGQFQTQGDRNHGCADPRKKPQAVVKRSFTTVVAMLSFNACQWNSQPITGKLAMILRSSCGALLAAIKPSPISRLADLPATRVPLAFSPPTRLR